MLEFVFNRLKEASSSRGLIWVLAGLGITVNPSNIQTILTYATAAVGTLGVLAPEGGHPPGTGFDPVGYVIERIKAGSTYRGLTWGATAWGMSHGIDFQTLVPLAASAVGALGILTPDAGNNGPKLLADPVGYLTARLGETSSYRSAMWLLAGLGISTDTISLTSALPLAAIASGVAGMFTGDKTKAAA